LEEMGGVARIGEEKDIVLNSVADEGKRVMCPMTVQKK